MPTWSRRRTRSLAEAVVQFLEGLAAHPEIRRRLRAHGYTEQDHRELQACLAQVGEAEEADAPDPGASMWGSARALGGWMTEQVAYASRAAGKLPDVAAEAADAVFGAEEPLEMVHESQQLWRRLKDDEHLSHFFTVSGLRDAGADLAQRVLERGAPAARSRRQQARRELGFLFTRWRQLCLRELADQPTLLAALGIDAPPASAR